MRLGYSPDDSARVPNCAGVNSMRTNQPDSTRRSLSPFTRTIIDPCGACLREGMHTARTVRRTSRRLVIAAHVVLIDTCGYDLAESLARPSFQHARDRRPDLLDVDEDVLGANALQTSLGARDAKRSSELLVDDELRGVVHLTLTQRALNGDSQRFDIIECEMKGGTARERSARARWLQAHRRVKREMRGLS